MKRSYDLGLRLNEPSKKSRIMNDVKILLEQESHFNPSTELDVDHIIRNSKNNELPEIYRISWKCCLINKYISLNEFSAIDNELNCELDFTNISLYYSKIAYILASKGHHMIGLNLLNKHKILEHKTIFLSAIKALIIHLVSIKSPEYKYILDKILYQENILDNEIIEYKIKALSANNDWKPLNQLLLTNFNSNYENFIANDRIYYLMICMIKTKAITDCRKIFEHLLNYNNTNVKFAYALFLIYCCDNLLIDGVKIAIDSLKSSINFNVVIFIDTIKLIFLIDKIDYVIMKFFRLMIENDNAIMDKYIDLILAHIKNKSIVNSLCMQLINLYSNEKCYKYYLLYITSASEDFDQRLISTKMVMNIQKLSHKNFTDPLIEAWCNLELNRNTDQISQLYCNLIINYRRLNLMTQVLMYGEEYIKMYPGYIDKSKHDFMIRSITANTKIYLGDWINGYNDIINFSLRLNLKERSLYATAKLGQMYLNIGNKFDALRYALEVINHQPDNIYNNALSFFVAAEALEKGKMKQYHFYYYFFIIIAYSYSHQLPTKSTKYKININLYNHGNILLNQLRTPPFYKYNLFYYGHTIFLQTKPINNNKVREIYPFNVSDTSIDNLFDSINDLYEKNFNLMPSYFNNLHTKKNKLMLVCENLRAL